MGSSDQPKALVDLENDWKDQNCSRRSLKKIKKIKSLVDLFSSILCQKIDFAPINLRSSIFFKDQWDWIALDHIDLWKLWLWSNRSCQSLQKIEGSDSICVSIELIYQSQKNYWFDRKTIYQIPNPAKIRVLKSVFQ